MKEYQYSPEDIEAEIIKRQGIKQKTYEYSIEDINNEIAKREASISKPIFDQSQKEYEKAQESFKMGEKTIQSIEDTPEFLSGIPTGIGNLGYGGSQATVSLIDPSSKSSMAQNLREKVQERFESQEQMSGPKKAGIKIGENIPFLAAGGTSIPAIVGASALERF